MDDLNIQVIQNFGFRAKKIIKEKSFYVIYTDKGLKMIKKTFESCDMILFSHEIKEHLFSKGFCNTDRFYLSAQKKPFVEYDNNIYVCTDLHSFSEPLFFDNAVFKEIVKNVAIFHSLARNIPFKGKQFYSNTSISDLYIKSLSEINTIKRKLTSQKKYTDFDVIFLKNYSYYKEQIETAIELLDKTNFNSFAKNAHTNGFISHNALKEENINIFGSHIHITNFSSALIDCQLFDLAYIIKRYIKSMPRDNLSLSEIINIYSLHNQLEAEEIEILYPLLFFPSKFVKICNQYYSKKRSWTPGAISSRIDTLINNKDVLSNFLNDF